MGYESTNRFADFGGMVISHKFFGYLLSFLLCVSNGPFFWRTKYWRHICAVCVGGMMGTFLETVEYGLIAQNNFAPFRVMVFFSECCWVMNEVVVVVIADMKLQAVTVNPKHKAIQKKTLIALIALLAGLRIWLIYARIARNSLWDPVVATAHIGYFVMLAVADAVYAVCFLHVIYSHFKTSSLVEANSNDIGFALKITSCIRLLIVNAIMIVLAISFFFIHDDTGKFLFDFTCSFKFHFGTIFLVDMLLIKTTGSATTTRGSKGMESRNRTISIRATRVEGAPDPNYNHV